MTVSEYIFDFIQKKGCETVFMVSGSSSMWLTDSLKRNEKLTAICCHHEQAAAMAADGYGRLHNIPGTCLVTIGPGAMNAITGVVEAYVDSSPVFVLSGQANSAIAQYEAETEIRQKGCQSVNLEPIVNNFTKYFAEILEPNTIRYHMERAYHEAITGRKGPVWLDIPVDIQNKQVPGNMHGYPIETIEYHLEESQAEKIAALIRNSEKPLILAGYGIRSSSAESELKQLMSENQIPAVTSRGGIDVIESDNPLFIGRPGSYGDRASHFAIQSCDLLLVLGSRLSISTIGYYPKEFAENAVKVMIDIDGLELMKPDVPIEHKLQTDVKEFLIKLNSVLQNGAVLNNHGEWIAACRLMKQKYPNVLHEYREENPLNPYYFTSMLTNEVQEDAVVVVDTGSVCNIVSQSWTVKKGQRYLISGGLSCMGYWAASIGVCGSKNQVVALTGDGSAQMNIQELATLKYNNLPVKLFVYNNNGYMLIRHNQHNYMNDRFLGVGPDSGVKTPDYIKVAEAYGIKAIRIKCGDSLSAKIREVLDYNGPVVCEVILQEFSPIVPRIASRVMPDGSLKAAKYDDLFPFLEP